MLQHARLSLLVLSDEVWCWGCGLVKTGPESEIGNTSALCDLNINGISVFEGHQCTMLGLLTTVVLFLRQRRTSLWNT